jgi:hypothetical protein
MRTALFLLLLFGCIQTAAARPHPIRWVARNKVLVISSAALFGSQAADVQTSIDVQRSCRTCLETNSIVGQHPSSSQFWLFEAALGAGGTFANWHALKSDSKIRKSLTLGLTGAAIMLHAYAAYHNSTVPSASQKSLIGCAGNSC